MALTLKKSLVQRQQPSRSGAFKGISPIFKGHMYLKAATDAVRGEGHAGLALRLLCREAATA